MVRKITYCLLASNYCFIPGIEMEMYDEDDKEIVEEEVYVDVLCDNCDTPGARKISGTAGHGADLHPCPWCHAVLLDVNRPQGYQFDGE